VVILTFEMSSSLARRFARESMWRELKLGERSGVIASIYRINPTVYRIDIFVFIWNTGGVDASGLACSVAHWLSGVDRQPLDA